MRPDVQTLIQTGLLYERFHANKKLKQMFKEIKFANMKPKLH